jgi:acyl dehydratase
MSSVQADFPIGTTIAHGYLLVSLMPRLLDSIVVLKAQARHHHGVNEVRFGTWCWPATRSHAH